MTPVLVRPVLASDLAAELGLPFRGYDVPITHVSTLDKGGPGALVFATRRPGHAPVGAVVISAVRPDSPAAWLQSDTPRLTFVKALRALDRLGGFEQTTGINFIEAYGVERSASFGRGVTIGSGTRIGAHVRIADNVTIGRDCIIKSGAVIGEDGFGFERDTDGTPLRMLHFGGVVIGDRVEIGSLTTVCQGTLEPTVIENDAKVDDHVHVAHNVRIGRKALIIACAELSGGVVVGERAWVGPNACVREHLRIGEGALVGIGSVVVKDVADGVTVCGNPARPM